jgi:hypothetical protein
MTLIAAANLVLTTVLGILLLAGRTPQRPEPRHPRSAREADTWPIPVPPPLPLDIDDDQRQAFMDAIRAHDAAAEPLPDGVRDAIEGHVARARATA